jgi:hypothetical protein
MLHFSVQVLKYLGDGSVKCCRGGTRLNSRSSGQQHFNLRIKLKTAKALGLTAPPSLLRRVIE